MNEEQHDHDHLDLRLCLRVAPGVTLTLEDKIRLSKALEACFLYELNFMSLVKQGKIRPELIQQQNERMF